MITPSDEQHRAIKAIINWYENEPDQQEFFLDGEAGTGKTSTVQVAIQELRDRNPNLHISQAAYTAKAALVMRQKGAPIASTIHRMIYKAYHDKDSKLFWALWENGPASRTDLIVIDECFVPQTVIDTPFGGRCIADLRPGDLIYSGAGIDTITAVSRKEVDYVVEVIFGGIAQACSPDHPFFTERGVVRARNLRLGERLCSTAQAMRFLQKYYNSQTKVASTILQPALCYELEAAVSGIQRETVQRGARQELWGRPEEVPSLRNTRSISADRQNTSIEPNTMRECTTKNKCDTPSNRATSTHPRGKWPWLNFATGCLVADPWNWMGTRVHPCNWTENQRRSTITLQDRLGSPNNEDWDRIGWSNTSVEESTRCGSSEGNLFDWPRVESITLLKQGDSRLDCYRNPDGKLYLYDLQATRHHSFSVGGVLVHNCSMISAKVANDLRSFGAKILVLGDVRGQLPPIGGEGAFTSREPDFRLLELNRFAMEDPINALAQRARKGGKLYPAFSEGNVKLVYMTPESSREAFTRPDTQIICGRHKVRWAITRNARARLGYRDPLPRVGEPLICCQNNYGLGILNGEFLEAVDVMDSDDLWIRYYDWNGDDNVTEGVVVNAVKTRRQLFDAHYAERKLPEPPYDRDFAMLDWAYAITCHKAQGSEWPHVTIVDDSMSFKWEADLPRRWLYTAISRASEGLILLLRK